MSDAVADSDVLNISELVRMRLAQGQSLRDLETASGGVVDNNTFFKLSQSKVNSWPSKSETIQGLARALGVDVKRVVHGYARQLGLDLHENRSLLASMLPSAADNLAPRQAQAITDLITAFAPNHTEQAPAVALDISDFSDENVRNVIALAGELKQRAERTTEEGNAEMAAAFDALAAFLEAAMRSAMN